MTAKQELSYAVKKLAKELGFSACGITSANELKDDVVRMKDWLKQGMHAGMGYMENHFEKRVDPSKLVPGAKSVIVVLLNYYPEQTQSKDSFQISKYAYGKDYHQVFKEKLRKFHACISEQIIPAEGRVFVDSAPVLERSLAARAGLGWIGKNGNLISPKSGSFFFIGELILDIELAKDKMLPDYCGGCTKCIQSCPTKAIVSPAIIDSRKCISYWTIEHKGPIEESLKGEFQDRIFGCDICQDVCPWNRKSKPTEEKAFQPHPDLIKMTKNDWHELTNDQFRELFRASAVKRTKYEGLKRNIEFVRQD